jgi:hypothetical protein
MIWYPKKMSGQPTRIGPAAGLTRLLSGFKRRFRPFIMTYFGKPGWRMPKHLFLGAAGA